MVEIRSNASNHLVRAARTMRDFLKSALAFGAGVAVALLIALPATLVPENECEQAGPNDSTTVMAHYIQTLMTVIFIFGTFISYTNFIRFVFYST